MLNHDQTLNTVFHALAEPNRRAIVEQLARGSASVSELAAPLAMSLAGVLQHMQVLEQSGLVTSHKVGRVRTCSLDPAAIDVIESWLSARRQQWESHFDRLGELLAAPSAPATTKGTTR